MSNPVKMEYEQFECELKKPVIGSTPFGYYDGEIDFQNDCYTCAVWAKQKLGWPTVTVELLDFQYYACFEEAVIKYDSTINNEVENYANIPVEGKLWIKEYFYALCKEVVGLIRRKYDNTPIPGGQVTLDGESLVREALQLQKILTKQLSD